MTTRKRVLLYERLPEIYRIKDGQLSSIYLDADGAPVPDYQLRSFLEPVEEAFGAIHENIESLYHDFFIETCDEWVMPYIGDLLGTTHLTGDPWTLRADIADTIALRRRKGTLHAVELLVYGLTKWGVHCVELRENLAWHQHLNHQRPDVGGAPPFGAPGLPRQAAIRGGTVTLRDPALLSLLNTPFDPFAHITDVRPPDPGHIRYNLPNLAIFLWRLAAYRVRASKPFAREIAPAMPGDPHLVRVALNPIPTNALSAPYVETVPDNSPASQPLQLFNTHRTDILQGRRTGRDKLDLLAAAPRLSGIDEVPGAIPPERLTENSPAGAPQDYFSVETYDPAPPGLQTLDLSDVGLQLHLPAPPFLPGELYPPSGAWAIRGENLCAWERGLNPPLKDREIAVDPLRGRILVGVNSDTRAKALVDDLLVTFTYGAAGPVGAHPLTRPSLPPALQASGSNLRRVSLRLAPGLMSLHDALKDVDQPGLPIVVEIMDSFTHKLDLSAGNLPTIPAKNGVSLSVNRPLTIRAADNQRPIIALTQPLGFRPTNVQSANPDRQKEFDAVMDNLTVRLEGIFLTRGETFAKGKDLPLINRAALNRLEMLGCTLDPGGFRRFKGTRAPVLPSLKLSEPYGFDDADEERAFKQTPEIVLSRTISGPLLIDEGYRLCLTDSIVDAGQGVDNAAAAYAIAANTDVANAWGPPVMLRGATVLGCARVARINGQGGIFVHALEVFDQNSGCLKFSYFSGEPADRLPQNHACIRGRAATPGAAARLQFTSEVFGAPAYCQLALSCDPRLREQGPNDDAMGAFGFLQEAHKWRNLQIRFREFMPVGIRPLLLPVT